MNKDKLINSFLLVKKKKNQSKTSSDSMKTCPCLQQSSSQQSIKCMYAFDNLAYGSLINTKP